MSLAKNAGRMSIAVFLSRILGLVREQVFAALFGAGLVSDAYLVAFRIPNLLRDLFAEGALSQAFVTVFSRTDTEEEKRRLARDVMTALTVIVGITCLGIALAAPYLVELMAGKFAAEPGKLELTIGLTRLFSPFLYFASSAALAMGILNTLGSFFIPAMGSAAFNLGNIVVGGGLAWMFSRSGMGPTSAIWGFGIGTLAGGFLQWSVQWPTLRQKGYMPWAGATGIFSSKRVAESFRDPGFRTILALMAPAILSIASVQLNTFIGTWFAASLEQGSVSWISYAYRLMHFPMGVFGVALSTAALPRLASLIKDNKRLEFGETLENALGMSWILALGSTCGLILFREPLISLLYQHGRFTYHDTQMTALALMAYAIGLVAFIQTKILVQAFYALNRVWFSSTISLVSVLMSAGLNFVLARYFGHAGVPLSTALTAWAVTFALAIALRRQGVRFLSAKTWKLGFVSLVSAAISMGSLELLGVPTWLLAFRVQQGFLPFAMATLAVVAGAGAFYVFLVALLTPQGRLLWQRLRSRSRKS